MNDHMILEEEIIGAEQEDEAARLGNAITHQPIRGLPTLRPAICVPPSATVRVAITKMNEHRVGCVLVQEGERLVGVFTERDVLTKVVDSVPATGAATVGDLMTADPECLTLDDGIVYALNKMSIGGFRHIPLIDDQGRPTGIVAMRDIVDFIVHLFPREVLNLPPSPGHIISRTREGA